MTEWEKAQNGYMYDPFDPAILEMRNRCNELCYELNSCRPSEMGRMQEILKELFGEVRGTAMVMPNFHCDYGFNISVGNNFFANYNVTILDCAKVTFGNNILIAPHCVFSAAGHAIDPEQRAAGLEIALPITVGDNVWFGTNVSVLPGVTIGSDSIIGAGSVVNKDIPAGVIAAGSPCKVIREITETDKEKYPMWVE